MTQTFSPSEAAFSVFELTKRQPQFVMRFALLSAAIMALTIAILVVSGAGDALQRYMVLMQSDQMPSSEQIQAILGPSMPAILFFFLCNSVLYAFLTGMALRKTIHDRESGFWGLQVGGMEWRYLLSSFMFGVILALAMVLMMVLASFLSLVHDGLGAAAFVVVLPAMIYVALRLSQFGVMGAVSGSLGLVESINQTKGQFWRYFGAYVLWAVLAIIIGTVVQALANLGAMALGKSSGREFPATLGDMVSVGWAFYYLVYGSIAGILNLGFICIGAYAWHQSRGHLPPPKLEN